MHGVTIRLHANKITIYTLDSRTIAQPAIKHSLEYSDRLQVIEFKNKWDTYDNILGGFFVSSTTISRIARAGTCILRYENIVRKTCTKKSMDRFYEMSLFNTIFQ
jgi:uncharacterized protein YerC